jgi:hypothetical protein
MADNKEKETPAPVGPTAGELLKQLDRVEAKMLLDVSDVEKKHPDKRVKWLNLRNTEKVESRKLEGYTRLGTEEGGKTLGSEMATFVIPREVYDRMIAAQKRINRERLSAKQDELSSTVEAVLRELRDRHGIKLDERQLLIDEG